ncbi:hypothetical protein JHK87_012108 [Glycine soja]|nr:hypothetical protein JHK87_012108 [Glycine soja]
MKVSKDYLNFQPCTLEGAEANKWRWFELMLALAKPFRFKVLQNRDDIVDLCAKD